MSFEGEFEEFMTETVTLASVTATDTYGSATYGTEKTVQARIEQFAKKVIDAQGREVVSMTRLYLKPTDTGGVSYVPAVSDKVTLPDGYVPQMPPILSVERQNDQEGLHHYVLNLGG